MKNPTSPEVAHYYLGCFVNTYIGIGKSDQVNGHGGVLIEYGTMGPEFEAIRMVDQVTPILRPISDLTDYEARMLSETMENSQTWEYLA